MVPAPTAPADSEPPRRRAVLLGASNLSLYLPRALGGTRAALGGPIELFVANGFGRSYGEWSRVLWRELPGISTAGLWDALAAAHAARPLPASALVTDVGNDLVYGARAERVAGWVGTCLERLAELDAATTLALLPLESVEALGPARFGAVRALFFPSHRVTLDGVRGEARELQERLVELAARHGATTVEQDRSWFGLDPIHIRPRRASEAWARLLGPFGPSGDGDAAAGGPGAGTGRLTAPERRRARAARPAERRVRGRLVQREQPSALLDDGTALHLY